MILYTAIFNTNGLKFENLKNLLNPAIDSFKSSEGYISHNLSRAKNGGNLYFLEVYFDRESAVDNFRKNAASQWYSFLDKINSRGSVTERITRVDSLGADGCSG